MCLSVNTNLKLNNLNDFKYNTKHCAVMFWLKLSTMFEGEERKKRL